MCIFVAGHLMLPLSAPIFADPLPVLLCPLLVITPSHHMIIIATHPDESTQPDRDHMASILTLCCRFSPSMYKCWINPSLVLHSLSDARGIATICLLLSLWWCDGNQVLYCKTVYSALPSEPCSYQHQPSSRSSKKLVIESVCACKLTHIYVPCFENLALYPLFMIQNSFLLYCKWAESTLSVLNMNCAQWKSSQAYHQ